MYYADKIQSLKELFGTDELMLEENALIVSRTRYPIHNDVIVITETGGKIAETFSREWKAYDKILPEHAEEFASYTDLIQLSSLQQSRVCDLGCGNGRWSAFLAPHCRELILVDFSDAIFTARENLKNARHALFFKCDLQQLPFKKPFANLIVCLGVLHHLPTPCLNEVRALQPCAQKLLIYLYYSLDNRPWHFRAILALVTAARNILSSMTNEPLRRALAKIIAYTVYLPAVLLGRAFHVINLGRCVPLYEAYRGKSMWRVEQDAYDRFFTPIEQRVSRADIEKLTDTFSRVRVSPHAPYYHFLCES